MNIRKLFKRKVPLVTVTFYMKSGNKIVCDRVENDFTIRTVGCQVTSISNWGQRKPVNGLMLTSLTLDQIEAIIIN